MPNLDNVDKLGIRMSEQIKLDMHDMMAYHMFLLVRGSENVVNIKVKQHAGKINEPVNCGNIHIQPLCKKACSDIFRAEYKSYNMDNPHVLFAPCHLILHSGN